MAGIYKPKITEGATSGFNPKCNQTSGAQFASPSIPSAAEVAEEVMRKRAADPTVTDHTSSQRKRGFTNV